MSRCPWLAARCRGVSSPRFMTLMRAPLMMSMSTTLERPSLDAQWRGLKPWSSLQRETHSKDFVEMSVPRASTSNQTSAVQVEEGQAEEAWALLWFFNNHYFILKSEYSRERLPAQSGESTSTKEVNATQTEAVTKRAVTFILLVSVTLAATLNDSVTDRGLRDKHGEKWVDQEKAECWSWIYASRAGDGVIPHPSLITVSGHQSLSTAGPITLTAGLYSGCIILSKTFCFSQWASLFTKGGGPLPLLVKWCLYSGITSRQMA